MNAGSTFPVGAAQQINDDVAVMAMKSFHHTPLLLTGKRLLAGDVLTSDGIPLFSVDTMKPRKHAVQIEASQGSGPQLSRHSDNYLIRPAVRSASSMIF